MNTRSEIDRLKSAKTGISEAIQAKGVNVPVDSLIDTYPDLIAQIQQGGGGGGGTDIPNPPDDGKTRLYIHIAPSSMEGQPPPRNNPTLYFSQTVSNGVTIDWGDGTATETVSGTGNVSTSHVYEAAGDYAIALTVADGCEVGLVGPITASILDKLYDVALTHVVIGKNVTNIGSYAFTSCYSLRSITISDSVTDIYVSAFGYCYSLSSVTIPDSVTSIEDSAFGYCYSLSSVTIPDSVTSIGDYAFYYCYSLSSVTIPDSVTSIGNYAFRNCTFAKAFYILPVDPPTLEGTSCFDGLADDCVLYVPAQSVDAYKAATNWAEYADRIQAMPE